MKTLDRISYLIQKGHIDEAVKDAIEKVNYPYATKEDYRSLFDALVIRRDIRNLGKYLRKYRTEFGKDQTYMDYLSIYLFRSLEMENLMKVLPYADNSIKFWILSALGYTDEAEKLNDGGTFKNFQLAFFRGKRIEVKGIPKFNLEKVLASKYQALINLAYGKIPNAIDIMDEVIDESMEKGFLGWALDCLVYRNLIKLDRKNIAIALRFADFLGDNFNLEKLKIIRGVIEGEDYKNKKVENVPILKVMRDYAEYVLGLRGRMDPYEGLEGVYNIWWYVDKIRNSKVYMSFVGKLRLMRGSKVIELNKRYLLTLAYWKILGKDGLMRRADKIFKNSRDPKKRALENLSRMKDYRYAPTDIGIAVRTGTFLKDEEDSFWKEDFIRSISR